RFGAYHIYFPQLLKPAARSLASLLWAEKQSNVDMAALSNVQHLASSGRTSFPVDKALPRDGYRVLGYRQCGERAVRVDILERLADLIRPALAWRETSPGEKPAGAFDGRGFVVTQAMTSLTGSAGEDFASILRALGYRMDRRPPLPPKPVAATPVEATETVAAETTEAPAAEASVEAGSDAAVDAPAEAAAELTADAPEAATDQVVSGDPAPSAALLPDVGFAEVVASEATPVVIETRPEPEPVAEVAAEPAALAEQPVAEVPASEAAPAVEAAAEAPSGATAEAPAQTAGTEAATAEAAPAPAETPAEPQLVEVWRPGGRSDERRPHHRGGHDRNRGRHQGKPAEGAQAAEGGGEGEKREHHRRPRRHQDFRTPRPGAPADATAAAAAPADGAPARDNRQDNRDDRGQRRERFEGKGFEGKGRDRDNNERRRDNKFGGGDRKGERGDRDRGGRDKGGRDKRESGPSHRPYASSAPRERDRPIDPNSPFAKLAALKEQLAGRKE
ncbi:MAG: ATP-dependent RNA helicase SUPV3L1/SUV3, partial [Pseudomonadota bacterium]